MPKDERARLAAAPVVVAVAEKEAADIEAAGEVDEVVESEVD